MAVMRKLGVAACLEGVVRWLTDSVSLVSSLVWLLDGYRSF